MIAALVYSLCLLYAPPTKPVYQGYAMMHVDQSRIWFARTNGKIESIEGAGVVVLIGISDRDKKIFIDNPGKMLQLIARETECHGTQILRVSWWKFAPTKEPKK